MHDPCKAELCQSGRAIGLVEQAVGSRVRGLATLRFLDPRIAMPHRALTLTLLAALTLSGCAASLAAGAIGAAARSAQGDPNAYHNNEALKLAAAQACRARAAPQGEVHVIDLEQRSARRVVVWGTATNASARQSFECTYTDRVTGFRLRRLDR
jgi:hypothetical protein